MISVAGDYDGLRMAALELFEEDFRAADNERRIANLDPQDLAQMEKLLPARKLSPGYYDQVGYLLWAKKMKDAGAGLALTADEVEGTAAVMTAYQEFAREHPACGYCGTRQAFRGAKRCHGCMREIG